MAKVAAHDLQEPLRKIEVFAGLLQDSGNDSQEKSDQYLTHLVAATHQ